MEIIYPENMRCQLEYDSRDNFLIKYEQDGECFRNIPEIVNKDSELFYVFQYYKGHEFKRIKVML